MTQPHRKVQRAFTGLVGLPPEPTTPEAASTPAAVVAEQPVVPDTPTVVIEPQRPKSLRGGLSSLASQAYRRRRDPTTGKVIEPEPPDPEVLQVHTIRAAWRAALQSAGVNPQVKCIHGHMYAEHYCDVCRLAPVDPYYNPDVYRTEINKALANAKRRLMNGAIFIDKNAVLDANPHATIELSEGQKDYEELLRVVDIEIWKAAKKYGDGMNAALAYTIAENQSGKYLTQRIEEQTVESTDPEGNAIRIPRFDSMDNKPLDEDGDEQTTMAEVAVVNSPAQGTEYTPIQIEQLQTLVATWRGDKKLVGEAMLRPGFNVRSVPGVSKSTVARVRQVVLREFKALISKGLTK
jgi:hypothetical protein